MFSISHCCYSHVSLSDKTIMEKTNKQKKTILVMDDLMCSVLNQKPASLFIFIHMITGPTIKELNTL